MAIIWFGIAAMCFISALLAVIKFEVDKQINNFKQ